MKKLSKIVFYLIFFSVTFSQAQEKLPQSDIDTLYVKALRERVLWELSSGYKYVDLEEQTNAAKNMFKNGMMKIVSHNEIIDIARKTGKELTVHTLEYLIISKDTVDVNFNEYYVKPQSKESPLTIITKNVCQGTSDSYIPDIRFVLVNKEWKVIQSKFLKH